MRWPRGRGSQNGRRSPESLAAAARLDHERLDYASAVAVTRPPRVASRRCEIGHQAPYRGRWQFQILEMRVHEAVTRFRLGELLESEEGQGLGAHCSTDRFHTQQIKNADCLVRMVLP